jgi:DeoR/GlpR family transcriptional regulator of sugar metabolism
MVVSNVPRLPNDSKRSARVERIVAILRDQGNASFEYLASVLETSQITIRRDIASLGQIPEYRFIQRVPGGVIHLGHKLDLEYMFDLKLSINKDVKDALAHKAMELIDDGDGLVLDSGTTCLAIARQLHHRNGLRVLATDVKVAEELAHHGNIAATIVCGEVRPGYYTIGGDLAIETLGKLHFEKAFLSADAVDVEHGVTNTSMFEVGVKRRLAERSGKVILVADSSKFGKLSMFPVIDLSQVHIIITDQDLDPAYAERIRARGIELVFA